jgi:hypothetical protein
VKTCGNTFADAAAIAEGWSPKPEMHSRNFRCVAIKAAILCAIVELTPPTGNCTARLGYGAKGHTHKESFMHISRDLPVMISVVDTEEKLKEAMDTIESMMQDGLIVTSDVEIVRLVRTPPGTEVPDATRPPG